MDTHLFECPKCSGFGFLEGLEHVESGRCFRCEGTGKVASIKKDEVASQVCEHINNLGGVIDGRVYLVVFYAWDAGTYKDKSGTGRFLINRLHPTKGWEEVEDSGSIPLEELRKNWRRFKKLSSINDNFQEFLDNTVYPNITCEELKWEFRTQYQVY